VRRSREGCHALADTYTLYLPRAQDMIRLLVEGHETVARTAREIFRSAEGVNDQPTCALLTQRMQVHEKTAWDVAQSARGVTHSAGSEDCPEDARLALVTPRWRNGCASPAHFAEILLAQGLLTGARGGSHATRINSDRG
jgi:hypothetical protein